LQDNKLRFDVWQIRPAVARGEGARPLALVFSLGDCGSQPNVRRQVDRSLSWVH
jgi:hypothetical protein